MLFDCMQVYERTDRIFILCQNLEDVSRLEDRCTSVQEFIFAGENIPKLYKLAESKGQETRQYKEHAGVPALVDYIGWLYHHDGYPQSFFESESFADDCRSYGITYDWARRTTIWTHPKRPEETADFVNWLRARHIRLPENYRPKTVRQSKTYWPLAINLKTKTAQEIIGITPCACYVSGHVIIPYTDLKLFVL